MKKDEGLWVCSVCYEMAAGTFEVQGEEADRGVWLEEFEERLDFQRIIASPGDGRIDFSKSRCEFCEIDLAGERYEMIISYRPGTFAVWYCSAGCLPDSGFPEFIGTKEQCETFVSKMAQEYVRPDVSHDLYSLSIEQVG